MYYKASIFYSNLYNKKKLLVNNAKILFEIVLKKQFLVQFLLSCILALPQLSYGILSATTVNDIQGTAPYLVEKVTNKKIDSLSQLIHFTMPGQDGSSTVNVTDEMAGSDLITPSAMKFSDIKFLTNIDGKQLIIGDGQEYDIPADVVSDDGDVDSAVPESAFIEGKIKATWYDGGTKVTNLGQSLDDCGGPYTLKIEFTGDVSANTQYGLPRSQDYGTYDAITYTFVPKGQKICYVRPLDLTIFPVGKVVDNKPITASEVKYSQGYNPEMWVPEHGFKVTGNFPTTGFAGAEFSLIGPGNDQSKYRCFSSDNGGKISLSTSSLGENCTITYNSSKKSEFILGGTPSITMEYKNTNGSWAKIGDYKIPTPNKWPILAKGVTDYGNQPLLDQTTQFNALDACRLVVDGSNTPKTTLVQATDTTTAGKNWRQKYMYRREEISNTPFADPNKYPEGQDTISQGGFFSRDTDGTLTAEWGDLHMYKKSNWSLISNPLTWLAEVGQKYTSSTLNGHEQLAIYLTRGSIISSVLITDMVTPCRGDNL